MESPWLRDLERSISLGTEFDNGENEGGVPWTPSLPPTSPQKSRPNSSLHEQHHGKGDERKRLQEAEESAVNFPTLAASQHQRTSTAMPAGNRTGSIKGKRGIATASNGHSGSRSGGDVVGERSRTPEGEFGDSYLGFRWERPSKEVVEKKFTEWEQGKREQMKELKRKQKDQEEKEQEKLRQKEIERRVRLKLKKDVQLQTSGHDHQRYSRTRKKKVPKKKLEGLLISPLARAIGANKLNDILPAKAKPSSTRTMRLAQAKSDDKSHKERVHSPSAVQKDFHLPLISISHAEEAIAQSSATPGSGMDTLAELRSRPDSAFACSPYYTPSFSSSSSSSASSGSALISLAIILKMILSDHVLSSKGGRGRGGGGEIWQENLLEKLYLQRCLWSEVSGVFTTSNVQKMRACNTDELSGHTLAGIYIVSSFPSFHPVVLAKESSIASKLCKWVLGLARYHSLLPEKSAKAMLVEGESPTKAHSQLSFSSPPSPPSAPPSPASEITMDKFLPITALLLAAGGTLRHIGHAFLATKVYPKVVKRLSQSRDYPGVFSPASPSLFLSPAEEASFPPLYSFPEEEHLREEERSLSAASPKKKKLIASDLLSPLPLASKPSKPLEFSSYRSLLSTAPTISLSPPSPSRSLSPSRGHPSKSPNRISPSSSPSRRAFSPISPTLEDYVDRRFEEAKERLGLMEIWEKERAALALREQVSSPKAEVHEEETPDGEVNKRDVKARGGKKDLAEEKTVDSGKNGSAGHKDTEQSAAEAMDMPQEVHAMGVVETSETVSSLPPQISGTLLKDEQEDGVHKVGEGAETATQTSKEEIESTVDARSGEKAVEGAQEASRITVEQKESITQTPEEWKERESKSLLDVHASPLSAAAALSVTPPTEEIKESTESLLQAVATVALEKAEDPVNKESESLAKALEGETKTLIVSTSPTAQISSSSSSMNLPPFAPSSPSHPHSYLNAILTAAMTAELSGDFLTSLIKRSMNSLSFRQALEDTAQSLVLSAITSSSSSTSTLSLLSQASSKLSLLQAYSFVLAVRVAQNIVRQSLETALETLQPPTTQTEALTASVTLTTNGQENVHPPSSLPSSSSASQRGAAGSEPSSAFSAPFDAAQSALAISRASENVQQVPEKTPGAQAQGAFTEFAAPSGLVTLPADGKKNEDAAAERALRANERSQSERARSKGSVEEQKGEKKQKTPYFTVSAMYLYPSVAVLLGGSVLSMPSVPQGVSSLAKETKPSSNPEVSTRSRSTPFFTVSERYLYPSVAKLLGGLTKSTPFIVSDRYVYPSVANLLGGSSKACPTSLVSTASLPYQTVFATALSVPASEGTDIPPAAVVADKEESVHHNLSEACPSALAPPSASEATAISNPPRSSARTIPTSSSHIFDPKPFISSFTVSERYLYPSVAQCLGGISRAADDSDAAVVPSGSPSKNCVAKSEELEASSGAFATTASVNGAVSNLPLSLSRDHSISSVVASSPTPLMSKFAVSERYMYPSVAQCLGGTSKTATVSEAFGMSGEGAAALCPVSLPKQRVGKLEGEGEKVQSETTKKEQEVENIMSRDKAPSSAPEVSAHRLSESFLSSLSEQVAGRAIEGSQTALFPLSSATRPITSPIMVSHSIPSTPHETTRNEAQGLPPSRSSDSAPSLQSLSKEMATSGVDSSLSGLFSSSEGQRIETDTTLAQEQRNATPMESKEEIGRRLSSSVTSTAISEAIKKSKVGRDSYAVAALPALPEKGVAEQKEDPHTAFLEGVANLSARISERAVEASSKALAALSVEKRQTKDKEEKLEEDSNAVSSVFTEVRQDDTSEETATDTEEAKGSSSLSRPLSAKVTQEISDAISTAAIEAALKNSTNDEARKNEERGTNLEKSAVFRTNTPSQTPTTLSLSDSEQLAKSVSSLGVESAIAGVSSRQTEAEKTSKEESQRTPHDKETVNPDVGSLNSQSLLLSTCPLTTDNNEESEDGSRRRVSRAVSQQVVGNILSSSLPDSSSRVSIRPTVSSLPVVLDAETELTEPKSNFSDESNRRTVSKALSQDVVGSAIRSSVPAALTRLSSPPSSEHTIQERDRLGEESTRRRVSKAVSQQVIGDVFSTSLPLSSSRLSLRAASIVPSASVSLLGKETKTNNNALKMTEKEKEEEERRRASSMFVSQLTDRASITAVRHLSVFPFAEKSSISSFIPLSEIETEKVEDLEGGWKKQKEEERMRASSMFVSQLTDRASNTAVRHLSVSPSTEKFAPSFSVPMRETKTEEENLEEKRRKLEEQERRRASSMFVSQLTDRASITAVRHLSISPASEFVPSFKKEPRGESVYEKKQREQWEEKERRRTLSMFVSQLTDRASITAVRHLSVFPSSEESSRSFSISPYPEESGNRCPNTPLSEETSRRRVSRAMSHQIVGSVLSSSLPVSSSRLSLRAASVAPSPKASLLTKKPEKAESADIRRRQEEEEEQRRRASSMFVSQLTDRASITAVRHLSVLPSAEGNNRSLSVVPVDEESGRSFSISSFSEDDGANYLAPPTNEDDSRRKASRALSQQVIGSVISSTVPLSSSHLSARANAVAPPSKTEREKEVERKKREEEERRRASSMFVSQLTDRASITAVRHFSVSPFLEEELREPLLPPKLARVSSSLSSASEDDAEKNTRRFVPFDEEKEVPLPVGHNTNPSKVDIDNKSKVITLLAKAVIAETVAGAIESSAALAVRHKPQLGGDETLKTEVVRSSISLVSGQTVSNLLASALSKACQKQEPSPEKQEVFSERRDEETDLRPKSSQRPLVSRGKWTVLSEVEKETQARARKAEKERLRQGQWKEQSVSLFKSSKAPVRSQHKIHTGSRSSSFSYRTEKERQRESDRQRENFFRAEEVAHRRREQALRRKEKDEELRNRPKTPVALGLDALPLSKALDGGDKWNSVALFHSNIPPASQTAGSSKTSATPSAHVGGVAVNYTVITPPKATDKEKRDKILQEREELRRIKEGETQSHSALSHRSWNQVSVFAPSSTGEKAGVVGGVRPTHSVYKPVAINGVREKYTLSPPSPVAQRQKVLQEEAERDREEAQRREEEEQARIQAEIEDAALQEASSKNHSAKGSWEAVNLFPSLPTSERGSKGSSSGMLGQFRIYRSFSQSPRS